MFLNNNGKNKRRYKFLILHSNYTLNSFLEEKDYVYMMDLWCLHWNEKKRKLFICSRCIQLGTCLIHSNKVHEHEDKRRLCLKILIFLITCKSFCPGHSAVHLRVIVHSLFLKHIYKLLSVWQELFNFLQLKWKYVVQFKLILRSHQISFQTFI